MPDGTHERPVKPKFGRRVSKPKNLKDLTKEGCGYWEIQFVSDPPSLVKDTVTETMKDKSKRKRERLSFDNKVYFFPNPNNDCKDYAFMQFVRRTAHNLNADGSLGDKRPEYSDDWHPDIEGWKDRAVQKFIDIGEIFYDPKLIETVGKAGWVRRDGPGIVYPLGQPPKSLKICWDFQIYVVCDGGAKAVGRLDFSFCIVFDGGGKWSLEFPKEGESGYPSLHVICCRGDDDYFEWIERWHSHYRFGDLPKDDKRRAKFLKAQRGALDQAIRDRKEPLNLSMMKVYKNLLPSEYRYGLVRPDGGLRYDNMVFIGADEEDAC